MNYYIKANNWFLPVKIFTKKFDVSISKIGFSFGGLLACSIASNLWNLPYFNADILLKNVACIMFGPPCVSLPRIEDAICHYPNILESFHSFFLKDDFIPKLYSLRHREGLFLVQHYLSKQVC